MRLAIAVVILTLLAAATRASARALGEISPPPLSAPLTVAVCLAGGLRSLPLDTVHENIRDNLLAPLRAAGHKVDVFLTTTGVSQEGAARGDEGRGRPVSGSPPQLRRASRFPAAGEHPMVCDAAVARGGLLRALLALQPRRAELAASSCSNAGNAQFQTVEACFAAAGEGYDFYVRGRPDAIFLRPVAPEALLRDALVTAPKVDALGNDQLFAMPARIKRDWYDAR